MNNDLFIAFFRIFVLFFVIRQFWKSLMGGIMTCILLVTPIGLYLFMRNMEINFEMELFHQMAVQNWNLLFSRPFHYTSLLLNLGAIMEKMLQV